MTIRMSADSTPQQDSAGATAWYHAVTLALHRTIVRRATYGERGMGRAAYYSPMVLGVLLVLGLNRAVLEDPRVAPLSEGARWAMLGVVCVLAGLLCQLLMIGAQGLFAQVLPVPGGRSVRGRPAKAAGSLIIVAASCAFAGAVFESEGWGPMAWGAWGLCLLSGVGALLIYIWSWPMAERDFCDRPS